VRVWTQSGVCCIKQNIKVGRRWRDARRGPEPLASVTAGSGKLGRISESPAAKINPIRC
jgi:hypothetical protein